MADNSTKTPFTRSLLALANRKAQDRAQIGAKATPGHVTKVDKDFVTIAFDILSPFTLPTVKVPQSFSAYGREPTQIGDKGMVISGDYYLGGESGQGGGTAKLYPTGNLTPTSFQPLSQTAFPDRNYNQHHMAGGPEGLKLIQSNPTTTTSTLPGRRQRSARYRPGVGFYTRLPNRVVARSGDNPAFMEIDQKGMIQHTSSDGKSSVQIDQENKRVVVKVPADGSHVIFLGGSGKTPSLYAPVATTSGPAVNVMAKYVAQED
jgi:hypothetical protein